LSRMPRAGLTMSRPLYFLAMAVYLEVVVEPPCEDVGFMLLGDLAARGKGTGTDSVLATRGPLVFDTAMASTAMQSM